MQKEIIADLEQWKKTSASTSAPEPARRKRAPIDPSSYMQVFGPHGETPISWVLSSVSTFQVRYAPPVPSLSLAHSIEALVEGSEMSRLRKSTCSSALFGLVRAKLTWV